MRYSSGSVDAARVRPRLGRAGVTLLSIVAILLAFAPASATAQPAVQERFVAHLNGGQETPPHQVVGTGFGVVKLNADETMITVDLRWSHLSGGATAAHIHLGPPGTAGPVVFPLAGVPASTSGRIPEQSFAISPDQVAQLEAGSYYFNVHTPAFPAGEIRGQILATNPHMEHFVAHLDGGQETPPNPVVGIGFGVVKLNAAETMITVDLSWSRLSGGAIAAHIHGPAGPGTAAPVVFPLTGVPPSTKGHIPEQSFAINAAQVAQLEAGLFYFNIHTPAFPGGEIRGQITAVG